MTEDLARARFAGVYAATTTPFRDDGSVDMGQFGAHCAWLIEEGVAGLIPNGSLGEYEALSDSERAGIVTTAIDAADGRVPVVPVFIEVSGCLPMCGHGTIGTATVLVEMGMVPVKEPVTLIRLDTPAGLVEASVAVSDGRATSVTIRNVPSYLHLRDATVTVPGIGELTLDVAFGGNFYAILPAAAAGLAVRPDLHGRIVATGLAVMDAVSEQLTFAHPENPDISDCRHVVFTEPAEGDRPARAAVAIHPGWVDRSPCGTGTSARMAQLEARGDLAIGEDFVHGSLIGTTFTGRLVERAMVGDFPAVVPTVRGRAWLTGLGHYLLDPEDPFPAGFLIGRRP